MRSRSARRRCASSAGSAERRSLEVAAQARQPRRGRPPAPPERLGARREIHHRVEDLALRDAAERGQPRRGVGRRSPGRRDRDARARPRASGRPGPGASVRRAARCGVEQRLDDEAREGARGRPAVEDASPASDGNCSRLPRVPEGGGSERREDPVGDVEVLRLETPSAGDPSASFCLAAGTQATGVCPSPATAFGLELPADELLRGLDAEAVVQVGQVEALLQARRPTRPGCELRGAEALEDASCRTRCVVASHATGSGPQSYSAQRGSPSGG